MEDRPEKLLKCSCSHCGQTIEFDPEMQSRVVPCPTCKKHTRLTARPEPVGLEENVVNRLMNNVETVVIGKTNQLLLAIAATLSEGHILLEDVPGVAKTMLARSIAQSIGCSFKRIQCTPDLLPSEITGASVFNPKTTDFEFRPGPIFAEIVLADEINRATPRTQAALLEAMSERQVTVDGVNYPLSKPFLIIATQNPIDHEGTFPLPEAQLDRFLVRLSLGYPGMNEEREMIQRLKQGHPIDQLESVISPEDILDCQTRVRQIAVDDRVIQYVLTLVRHTRDHHDLKLGASPRASLSLVRMAQAVAFIDGRDFVLPDDVKKVAPAVLEHRLILRPESRLRKLTAAKIVNEILEKSDVPTLTTKGLKLAID